MARGPKKHLKRLNAPKHWMLDKMSGTWAPRPSSGPHKLRECLPLAIILRNRLKYALTYKECQMICMEKCVKVDGKVRTDPKFPAGFMDVVSLEASADTFRLLYDTKGRFVLKRIKDEAAKTKLARVQKVATTAKKVPYLVTHDARTIRYPDPTVKVHDVVKINLETGKIEGVVKFETGASAMIIKGNNRGRVGVITHRDRHPGSFDIVHLVDATGNKFATRLGNVFVLDNEITERGLPKGKGIRMTIQAERAHRAAKQK